MNIHFFTAEFPYRKGEAFIENEIPILAKESRSISIYPYRAHADEDHRLLPDNCELISSAKTNGKYTPMDFLFIIRLFLSEFFLTDKKYYYLKKSRLWLSQLKTAVTKSKTITINSSKDVYYSYWMNEWAMVLLVLKKRNKIDHFIFRCGGFDIWNERHEGNYLPFRSLIYRNCSGVYPNSLTAEKYLKALKRNPNKIQHQYWGTKDCGLNILGTSEAFSLVSCSNVIPLKRMHLIIQILSELSFQVKWTHFGDGEEMESILKSAEHLKERHQINFVGNVSNEEVLEFYRTQTVNLFITTSSTEGLPVSIQEALSFGIPIIATNVGGMAEIVNEQTGILLDRDFEISNAVELIEKFRNSEMNTAKFRSQIRIFWEENFNAEITYRDFYRVLEDVFED